MALTLAHLLWMAVTLLPVRVTDADGRPVRPFDLRGAPAAVLVFVAVDCPISNGYAPELQRTLADARAAGLPCYLVYSDPATTPAAAKAHAAAYGYACPALLDPRHVLADRVGATVTPEAAVVAAGGLLLYRGRIDDRYVALGHKRQSATTHDLRSAIAAAAAGRPVPVATTRAIGCPI